ncbi:MAG: helix-turn-helix domain-containing protein [Nocardioidaceae bacterium]|nr:helix-turn-helix domain-containing protein [Nocardioidaceae bacterium]
MSAVRQLHGDGDDLKDLVAVTAQRLDVRLTAVTDAMTARLEGIGAIATDPQMRELLRASIESNLSTIMHMIQSETPVEQVRLPLAAEAYAERIAQRGISANALVRAYHMGQDDLREQLFTEVEQLDISAERRLTVVQEVTRHVYRYIDKAILEVLEIHQAEQRRWNSMAGNVASAMVHRILEGEDPPDQLAAQTGLVLAQHHVGLVLWSEGDGRGEPLRALEAAGRALAAEIGSGPPLFSGIDLVTAWLWIPRGRRTEPIEKDRVAQALARIPGGRAALGLPAAGLAGFRRTHRQAQSAREIALAGDDVVVAYDDPGVALVSMLARDLVELRDWVPDVLGPLADDSEPNQRLRETLLTFLDTGGSAKATAERLHLHRNTVRYRLDRAVELLGHDIDEARLDLEVALRCVQRLGRPVLLRKG